MYTILNKTGLHKAVAVFMIVSLLIMTPPKRTDALIVALIGLSAGAVIADLIILCAVGIICGDGNGGTTNVGTPTDPPGGTCVAEQGMPCALRNTCGVVGPTDGTIDCAGVCRGATVANEFTGATCTRTNACSMSVTGNEHCTDPTRCSVTAPADSLCVSLPLPDDALVITPGLIRVNDDANNDITITWNTGLNLPEYCTLTGPALPPGFTITSATGSITIENVTGQREYTLSCGTSERSANVLVIPELFES